MADEIRKTFHQQLDEIRGEIIALAARVTETIPRATHALLENDLEEAQHIISSDDAIDMKALHIEEGCYRALALQQPMAKDLRAIVAAMWIDAELERSADLAVNICKACRRTFGMRLSPKLRGLISQMSDESVRLTRLAIDSYVEANAGLAGALDDIDDRLDNMHAEYISAIFEAQNAGEVDVKTAVQLALVGRYLERIGDHAVEIGDRVQYMVTGWMPEHTGAAREAFRVARGIEGEPTTGEHRSDS